MTVNTSSSNLSLAGPLAALLLSTAALAQAPRRADVDLVQVVRDAHAVYERDGAPAALAGSVDARFGAGQVRVAARHADAPAFTMSLREIRRGGVTIAVPADAAPRSRTMQVDYDHGRGVLERYVARADGLKHSVLLREVIGGHGDLVVRYDVETDLRCAPAAGVSELRFLDAARGGVQFGAVVGIDAEGDRVTGSMNFDGAYLDLVLPASFVETAAWPIDVDPLISGVINTGVSFDDVRPDIAYDVTNDVYLVVFNQQNGGGDQDAPSCG